MGSQDKTCPLCGAQSQDLADINLIHQRLSVSFGEEITKLSYQNYLFLEILVQNQPNTVSYEVFKEILWGDSINQPKYYQQIIRIYAHNLRKILEGTGYTIKLVPGSGYYLEKT